ncbi:MAG: hypothetical protein AAFR81_19620 [Chloroflexota bacterium]
MAYSYKWLIEPHVLYCAFGGDLNGDELLDASRDAIAYYREGDASVKIHSIIDARDVQSYPFFNWKMPSTKESQQFRQVKNVGWIVLVTRNKAIINLSKLVRGVSRVQFYTTDTLESAVDFLHSKTTQLDWKTARQTLHTMQSR